MLWWSYETVVLSAQTPHQRSWFFSSRVRTVHSDSLCFVFPIFLNVIDFSIWPRRSFASNTYFSCFSDVFDVTLLLLLCVVQVQCEFNHVGFLQPLACVTADGDNGKANIDLFLWVFFVFEAFTHLTAQDSQNIFLIQSVDLVGWVLS